MSNFYARDLIRRGGCWAGPGNGWPLDAHSAAELDRYLATRRPRVIVECGSGSSTLLLARYAQATGARVVSLEHDERYARETIARLAEESLAGYVDIQIRSLRPATWPGIGLVDAPWYEGAEIPPDVDFVLIDGPPERLGGRAGVLPALAPYLRADGNWSAWLDDADRPAEQLALRVIWPAVLPIRQRWLPFGKKGAVLFGGTDAVYRAFPVEALPIDASDVALTILTGRRPDRLAELLDSLAAEAPGLLETAGVMILHNGGGAEGDELTREMIDRTAAVRLETSSLYGVGRATSLLENATRKSGRRYWLHLEDDWRLATLDATWLQQAMEALRSRHVAQVRLRHYSEPVRGEHMVTRRPISWGEMAPWPTAATAGADPLPAPSAVEGEAHLTFNPFLTVVGRLTGLFPTSNEAEFMAQGHALGWRRVAQLYPGAFVHTGGTSGGAGSLRANGGSR